MILNFVSRQNNILLVKLNSKNMRDYDFLKVTKMLYKLLRFKKRFNCRLFIKILNFVPNFGFVSKIFARILRAFL